jgi:hypothetical protein
MGSSSASNRQRQLFEEMDEFSREVLSTRTSWVHTQGALLLVVAKAALPFAPFYLNGALLEALSYQVVVSVEAGQTFVYSTNSLRRTWQITKQQLRSQLF